MNTRIIDLTFWKQFQSYVISGDKEKVADLSYFVSDDDREYFLEVYNEDFDETSINAFASTKSIELKKVIRASESSEPSPFRSLILPIYLSEVFLLKVHYIQKKSDDDFNPAEELRKDYIDEFEIDDDYGRAHDYDEEPEFEDDEVIDYTKVFVFGVIGDEFKYMGSYIIKVG
jgi:hypothetical protein